MKCYILFCFILLLSQRSLCQLNLCPDSSLLLPYCNCSDALLSDQTFLDCSGVQNEEQIEQIFLNLNNSDLSFYSLTIKNNRDLINLTRNVFGAATFEYVFFINDAIEYIDGSVFVQSSATLKEWEMRYCNLSSQGFPFGSLNMYSSLGRLYLEDAGKFEVFPSISSTSLTHLHIGVGYIQYISVQSLSDLPNLEDLNLQFNNISSLPPGIFGNNTSLRSVDLFYNNVNILVTGVFQNLKNLRAVELGGNGLVFIEPGSFYGLPSLEVLFLARNRMPYLSADSLRVLPALKVLDVGFSLTLQSLDKDLLAGSPLMRLVFAGFDMLTSISAGTFDVLTNGELDLQVNLLTTLDEDYLGIVLRKNNSVYIAGNPLKCGCDMAWLYEDPDLMTNLFGYCDNGTDLHNLDPSFFTINC